MTDAGSAKLDPSPRAPDDHAAQERQAAQRRAEPTPISLRSLPHWAVRTARADRASHRNTRRPLTAGRCLRSIRSKIERPIFLVGAPRSGTTFLGDVIGALPAVSYHFEPEATKAAARYVYEGRWGFRRARLFYAAVYSWLLRIHLDGDLRFAEKTPQNSFVIPFLARAFPDAQFIHIVRDGRDVALSYSRKPWLSAAAASSERREPGGYAYGPVARFWVEPERRTEFETTSDIHRCIWAWRRFVLAARAGLDSLPPERALELQYETLIHDRAGTAERIAGFLDGGAVRSTTLEPLLRALEQGRPDSIGAWRSAFDASQLEQIDAEAGPLLRSYGYT